MVTEPLLMPPSTPPIDEKSDSLGPGGLSLIAAMAVVLGLQVGLAVKAFVSNVYLVNASAAEVEGEQDTLRWSLEKALQWNPADYRAQHWLGALHKEANESDRAAASLLNCLQLAPNHVSAMLELSELYARTRDFEEADRLISRAAELAPGYWRLHESTGFREGVAGNHRRALKEFERAQKLSRGRSNNLAHQMAVAYLALDDPSMALAHAERAAENEPEDLRHHVLLAKVLLAIDRPGVALDVLSEALDARESGLVTETELVMIAEAYVLSAEAHWVTGRYGQSAESLQVATQLAPSSEAVLQGVRNATERATGMTPASFEDNAAYTQALYSFGKALAATDDTGPAISLLEASLAVGLARSFRADCAVTLAEVFIRLDRPDDALQVLQDTRRDAAPDAMLDVTLGDVLVMKGREAEARLHYLEVLLRFQLDPETVAQIEGKLVSLGATAP